MWILLIKLELLCMQYKSNDNVEGMWKGAPLLPFSKHNQKSSLQLHLQIGDAHLILGGRAPRLSAAAAMGRKRFLNLNYAASRPHVMIRISKMSPANKVKSKPN